MDDWKRGWFWLRIVRWLAINTIFSLGQSKVTEEVDDEAATIFHIEAEHVFDVAFRTQKFLTYYIGTNYQSYCLWKRI